MCLDMLRYIKLLLMNQSFFRISNVFVHLSYYCRMVQEKVAHNVGYSSAFDF